MGPGWLLSRRNAGLARPSELTAGSALLGCDLGPRGWPVCAQWTRGPWVSAAWQPRPALGELTRLPLAFAATTRHYSRIRARPAPGSR